MKKTYKEPMMKPHKLKVTTIMAGSPTFQSVTPDPESGNSDGANAIDDYGVNNVTSGWGQ